MRSPARFVLQLSIVAFTLWGWHSISRPGHAAFEAHQPPPDVQAAKTTLHLEASQEPPWVGCIYGRGAGAREFSEAFAIEDGQDLEVVLIVGADPKTVSDR